MNEGIPRTPREEVAHASMEGNVYMPQNALGITVRMAERCIRNENPDHMISELTAPIPDDEDLKVRTGKANAQHALHDIGRILNPNDVRRILAAGNIATLNFIASALQIGTISSLYAGSDITFDENGAWANETVQLRAQEVREALTQENITALRELFTVTKEALELPEVKEKLKERKELYKGWKDMSSFEQGKHKKEINRLSSDIIQRITHEVFEASEKRGDRESRIIASYIMREIGKYMPNF